MITIAYQPPERMFNDTLMAFKDFEEVGKRIACLIEDDPMGPVNRIVSLVVGRDQRRVKSVLVGWHVLVGAEVKVERVNTPTTTLWNDRWEPTWINPGRCGYRVTVDGREVLYASDAEVWPAPIPEVPRGLKLAQKRFWGAKRWLSAQPQAVTNRLARRLGYHRDDECGGWDE